MGTWVLTTYSIDLNRNAHLFIPMVLMREHHVNKKERVAEIMYISLPLPHGRKYSKK